MYGPPGVAKTALAKAFANESGAVMLNVKSSNIKSAFVGESERNMRGVFQLAEQLVDEGEKVVVFFDEIEALAPSRNALVASSIDTNLTVELLRAMNEDRPNVIILAASNAPDKIDSALTGNGSRFSVKMEIGFPGIEARQQIIAKLLEKFTDKSSGVDKSILFSPDIDIPSLASASDGMTGSDIEAAMKHVLMAKANEFAESGELPKPATNSSIYQAIKSVQAQKATSQRNYL